ncbi:hypothetical protein JYK22_42000 [Nonomuraea sp. RK-328]|nr:hypothetical protein [Nonomuraea sp. RK-328]
MADREVAQRRESGAWHAGKLSFPVKALASFGTETWAVGEFAAARWEGGGWPVRGGELALRRGTTEVYAVGSAGRKEPSAHVLNGVPVKANAMMWRFSGVR